MLVEDATVIRELIVDFLTKQGYEVSAFPDTPEALENLHRIEPTASAVSQCQAGDRKSCSDCPALPLWRIFEDSLRVHMHCLRRKLEVEMPYAYCICTERGIAYEFAVNPKQGFGNGSENH